MKQTELDTLMQQHPNLTSVGIVSPTDKYYVRDRQDLANSLEVVNFCIDWLKKNYDEFKKNISSYNLKHGAEKDYKNYVGNGQMIAAIFFLGYDYEIFAPNVLIKL